MPEITITVKCSNDTKYTMSVDTSKTVLDFKQLIAEKSDIAADRQRLIYSGRVLKDNDTLETYKIAGGHTVHMVAARESQSSQSTTRDTDTTTNNTTSNQSTQPQTIPPFGGTGPNPFAALGGFTMGGNNQYGGPNLFGDPNLGGVNNNGLDQVLGNPALMQYIAQLMQDPQFIDNVVAMNPQLASMAPQLRQLTQDPEFQSLLSNPEAIRRMATLNSLMGNNPWGSPSINNNNATPNTTTTNTNPTTTTTPSATNPPPINNPFLSLFNPAATTNPNVNPNANQQPPFQFDPSLLLGLGGLGATQTTTPMVPQQPPEERFQVQLQQLNDMGFWDAQKNIRALLTSGGNVNAAVELLLSGTLN